MILLVNNRNGLKSEYAMIEKLRKALKTLKIPYVETTSIRNDVYKFKSKIKGVIFSGSPLILTDKLLFETFANDIRALLEFDVPVLGICFGCQLLNLIFGGKLDFFNNKHKYFCEDAPVELKKSPLFLDFQSKDVSFCFSQLPTISKRDGIKEIAWFKKDSKKYGCGFEFRKGKYYGLMFHPEKDPNDYIIYKNFVEICNAYKASKK